MPVRFSMLLEGHAVDAAGRDLVRRTWDPRRPRVYPPDLLVLSPEGAVLARLDYAATAEETLRLLRGVLEQHPDLATPPLAIADRGALRGAEPPAPRSAPPEVPVALALRARFDAGERGPALLAEVEGWLATYGADATFGDPARADASARLGHLAGVLRYHLGDFDGADAAFAAVIARHPDHPLRHRAAYHRYDQDTWPTRVHPELAGARHPTARERPPEVPDPARRTANLAGLRPIFELEGLPFLAVPAGTFTLGGQPAWLPRELPLRRVTLTRGFALSAWPVTRAVWRRFRPDAFAGEAEGLAGELPAGGIAWAEAEEFCAWLSARAGVRARLPTEAEWERAARGGIEGAPYPWGEGMDSSRCNYRLRRPVPVGCYAPNGFGLFDMVGNVQEWTADRYAEDAYGRTEPEIVDPTGPASSELPLRVARGGLCGAEVAAVMCRNAFRLGLFEAYRGGSIGVRVLVET